MDFQFATPYAFFLLLLLPPLVYLELRRQRRRALLYSSTERLSHLPKTTRQKFAYLPLAIRALALVLLVVALARPQSGQDPVRDINEGVAIEMVIDRSSSMSASMQYREESTTRLGVVKQVFEEFVMGNNSELGGRPSDLIGAVSFAKYPTTISPLTHSHEALVELTQQTEIVENSELDGTAIGDAIALAASRLKTAEREMDFAQNQQQQDFTIKSKIMILLTDGEHNAGKRNPAEGASLAQRWGIKIYAISIGPEDDSAMESDEEQSALQNAAAMTGGLYRRAGSTESLRSVYEEIDRLEKTEVKTTEYLTYREYYLPFALAAFVLILLELLLRGTLLRRIPA
jgi:Ca-activated chloride channel family protein